MRRDQSLPLIYRKNSVRRFREIQNDSLYTNESSINFALLKKTLQQSQMMKSNSTQDIFLTQKSSLPNSQSTSFLFNAKNNREQSEYERNKNNHKIEEALYKKDYIKKFKLIKYNLYKKKFYKNIKLNNIRLEVNKNENQNNINNYEENNEYDENNDGESGEEDKEKIKIDFTKNLWGGPINLKNHYNYDIGGDNDSLEEVFTESNQENNDIESNKDTVIDNSNNNTNNSNNIRISLYLTDLQNSSNNNNNEIPFDTNFQNYNYMNKNKNNYKKIKIHGKEKTLNPFNFTRYSSFDNIARFHKLYRNYNSLTRKHFVNEKSPSFAFIRSCDKERVICNPLGLFKRKGNEHTLEMNNQHSSDNYLNCLSSGLKYANHLNDLEMSRNRFTHFGIGRLFSNLKENDSMIKNLVKINLSNNNMGDEGIEKLINYIEEKSCQLESINIEGNNLGDKNINNLCINIAQYIWSRLTYFNAGKNKITRNSEKGLLALSEKCTELVVLILRNNQINNSLATKLMNNLKLLYSLKVLDISWNLIGNHLIYPFLYEEAVNYYPKQNNVFNNFELDKIKSVMKMSFNRNPLLPSIDKNAQSKTTKSKEKDKTEDIITEIKNIKVPKRKPSNFAVELSNYIKSNLCPLIHLNISHNNLPYEDCILISEESKLNRSILGFHVDGNEMQIDPLGFIHPIDKKVKSFNYYSKSQISFDFENIKGLPKILMSPINNIRGRNNCWICECWKEIEFVLDLKIKDIKPKYFVVKIHLDFENYLPCDMIYKKKCFKLVRMCPPGRVKYFFTIDGNPVKNCYKEYEYKIKENEKPIKYTFDNNYIKQYNNIKSMLSSKVSNNIEIKNKINLEEYVDIQEDTKNEEDILISKTIHIYNYGIRNITPNNNIITHDYQSTLKYSIPRAENSSSRAQNQIPWQFADSIWSICDYYYEGETDEFIEKICDFDCKRNDFEAIFNKESDLIEAKKLLKENYRNILDCYITLSSRSGTHLWQITSNILMDWLNEKCNFFDEKYTSKHLIKIIENIFFNKKDKEDRKKYKNFPSNKYNLIRHSFISLLINISIDKYITVSKIVTNPLDSLKLSMENNFINAIKGYNHHLWRKERYYNEEIDNYIKAFLPLIDGLFHTFSIKEKEKREREEKEEEEEKEEKEEKEEEENVKKVIEENDNLKKDITRMTLEDFNNFISTFVEQPDYQISETPLIFHISKKIQIDEITNDDFLYLNLIEFCECLCRVIDIYSPPPPEEKKEDWPMDKRKDQLLIEKIENIMPQLFKKIEHPKFNIIRDKFISPLKDQITSLYIIDRKNNLYYSGYEKYFKLSINDNINK